MGQGGINMGMLDQIGANLAGPQQDPRIAQMQQALGPQSQASWQLGTTTRPGGMDYSNMWQRIMGAFR